MADKTQSQIYDESLLFNPPTPHVCMVPSTSYYSRKLGRPIRYGALFCCHECGRVWRLTRGDIGSPDYWSRLSRVLSWILRRTYRRSS